MDSLKTYHTIDVDNETASFAISKMEDIYKKRDGVKDEPHRHDYFTVLVVNKAKGIHKIDFNTYEMGDSQIYFVSPGQVHQVIENESSKGFAMTFSMQFLVENAIHLSFIESLNLFHSYGHSPPLQPIKKAFEKVEFFVNEIYLLANGNAKMKALSIGAYLKLILIECNNMCRVNPIDSYSEKSENRIIREFKDLVDEKFKSEHLTSYYANKLYVTSDHLNRIIKSTMGKTAKEYIQSRITTEAKRLLYFSKLTSKEIGYTLGFGEPANFSAFFKKCTGYSPSNFKKMEDLK